MAPLVAPISTHATNITWTNTVGGNWSVTNNWSPNQVPGISDTAIITNSGTYTVTVTTVVGVSNVFLGSSSGTQALTLSSGSLNATNISTQTTNGAITLAGGTIANATINLTNGTSLIAQSGTFNGVTMSGTLDVGNSVNAAGLTVTNGLVLNGTALEGNPTNSDYGDITFAGSQTLGGTGTVVFGNQPSSAYNALRLADGGTTLTIGSGITVEGQNGTIGYSSAYGGPQNVLVVNQGLISADVSGGTISIQAQPFINEALAQGTNGGSLTINVLQNNPGATLIMNGAGSLSLSGVWTNAGAINATNVTVNLGGSFTLADLGAFTRSGGTVNLTGVLTNTGTTLALNAASGSWVLDGGTVLGGTITTATGVSLVVNNGTFNGVTMSGTLDVGNSVNAAGLTVTNGLVLNGTALEGNPTNSDYGDITFAGSQTLGGTGTVVFGNQPSSAYNALRLADGGTTLTIGSGITVEGQNGTIGYSSAYGGPQNVLVVNQGLISADVSGGTILVDAEPFDNNGTLAATLGTAALDGSFNLASGTLEFGLSNTNTFGKIQISGSAALAGTVAATLLNGFMPAVSNSFPVLTYGSFTGAFTNTELPSGFVWQTNYGPTTFTLTVSGMTVSGISPVLKPILNPLGQLLLQFTGSTNAEYTVLASTNLAVPLSNWVTLGNASVLSNTLYQFIDTNSTNFPARFYMLRSP
jgi:hypothetical protein